MRPLFFNLFNPFWSQLLTTIILQWHHSTALLLLNTPTPPFSYCRTRLPSFFFRRGVQWDRALAGWSYSFTTLPPHSIPHPAPAQNIFRSALWICLRCFACSANEHCILFFQSHLPRWQYKAVNLAHQNLSG